MWGKVKVPHGLLMNEGKNMSKKKSPFAYLAMIALMASVLFILAGCSKTSTPVAATTTVKPTTAVNTTGGSPVTINLVAKGMAFDTKTITVPAGAAVTINFNNQDTVPHNFSLFTDSTATPPALFQGQIVKAATITYTFTAPTTPGTYFFRCDIHPTIMTGSFIVTAASSGGGGY
jgi:plastocyanin